MINDDLRLIFFRAPKTASTSFIRAIKLAGYNLKLLGDRDLKHKLHLTNLHHVPSRFLKEIIEPDKFKKYYKVAFSRNPWDRMVSMYRMSCGYKRSSVYDSKKKARTFKKWVNDFEPQDPNLPQLGHPSHKHMMPVSAFAEGADYIGRLENAQEGWNIICEKLGIPKTEFPHVNRSQHKHYTAYYDDASAEIVYDKYQQDIKCFNYKFGE
jgi:chondroitin 4-sulfotransferase 11